MASITQPFAANQMEIPQSLISWGADVDQSSPKMTFIKACIKPSLFSLAPLLPTSSVSFFLPRYSFLSSSCRLLSLSPLRHPHRLSFFPSTGPWTLLSPPGWHLVKASWWLSAECALTSDERHQTIPLCNCTEGQEERRHGSRAFLFSVFPHPSPIIAVFCYPKHTPPGEAARVKRQKADHTFACITYAGGRTAFAKVGHCQLHTQKKVLKMWQLSGFYTCRDETA